MPISWFGSTCNNRNQQRIVGETQPQYVMLRVTGSASCHCSSTQQQQQQYTAKTLAMQLSLWMHAGDSRQSTSYTLSKHVNRPQQR
jgi:hypothetical protein